MESLISVEKKSKNKAIINENLNITRVETFAMYGTYFVLLNTLEILIKRLSSICYLIGRSFY